MRGGREEREAEQQPRGGGGGGQHVVPAADSAPLSTEPSQGGGDQTPAGLRTPVTGPATATGFWLETCYLGRMKFLGQSYQIIICTHMEHVTHVIICTLYTFGMQSWTPILSDCLLE